MPILFCKEVIVCFFKSSVIILFLKQAIFFYKEILLITEYDSHLKEVQINNKKNYLNKLLLLISKIKHNEQENW